MGVEFTTERQPEERKPRGKGKKRLMLDAIRDTCPGGEHEFLKNLVTIGMGGLVDISLPDDDPEFEYKQPNPMLLSLVLNRIESPLKPVSQTYKFHFDENADNHTQAKQVLKAMADGDLPADIGQIMINSISAMLNIQEKTDFEERLKAIEDASKQD